MSQAQINDNDNLFKQTVYRHNLFKQTQQDNRSKYI